MIKYIASFFKIETVICFIVVGLALISLIRIAKGKKGSFNTSFFYDPLMSQASSYPVHSKSNEKKKKQVFSKGESECRRVLESIFQRSFPQSRPSFMRNSVTGSNLELDCFNEELKVACEYHGRQHYKYTPHWHPSKQHFYNQQYRDKETRELCKKNGIYLIEVPYTVPLNKIDRFIRSKL
jgi:hypothetical protein